jgi:hypothetical protein
MNINKINIIISFFSSILVFLYVVFATDYPVSYVLPVIIFIFVILIMVMLIKAKSK